jgi:phage tail-like protein
MGRVNLTEAKRFDVLRGYRFRVFSSDPAPDIGQPGGIDSSFTFEEEDIPAGFSSISGLSAEVESVEYREGTDEITMAKFEGLVSYGDVTLSKGVDPQGRLWAWFKALHGNMIDVKAAQALTSGAQSAILPGGRRTLTIEVLARGDINTADAARIYTLRNAWPRTFEVGDLDASSSDVLVETMTIAHEGLEVRTPSVELG